MAQYGMYTRTPVNLKIGPLKILDLLMSVHQMSVTKGFDHRFVKPPWCRG